MTQWKNNHLCAHTVLSFGLILTLFPVSLEIDLTRKMVEGDMSYFERLLPRY